MSEKIPRLYYIDWLRVITVFLLVPFHAGVIFIFSSSWWINNVEKSLATNALVAVLDQYHMPLLFLVAGAATWFSLGRRSGGEYLLERTKRLLVPAVIVSLVFIAPNHFLSQQHYFYQDPAQQAMLDFGLREPFGSYFEHYPYILRENLLPFTEGWSPGLLWFVWYLILFTLVLLPIFLLIRRKGDGFTSILATFLEKRGAIFLLFIPLALVQIYPPPPIMDSYIFRTFPMYYHMIFFIYGFFLFSNPHIQRGLERSGPIAVVGGIITMTIFMLLVFPPDGRAPLGNLFWPNLGSEPGTAGHFIYWTLRAINGWFWITGLLYLSKRFLNFSNRLLRYANDAVLPFYMMHETIIVVVGFYVIETGLAVGLKYGIIVTSAYVLTLLLYEIIRRNNVTRFLMGMRLKRKIEDFNSAEPG